MHELSIAQSLLETVTKWQEENGGRVKVLRVALGRLGGVDGESLRFAWPLAVEVVPNPAIRECRLEVELLPLNFVCSACGGTCSADRLIWSCPACGKDALQSRGGRELILKNIEVEDV